jgi:cobalt-zinc-cadmium resistance protein CzcA
MSALIRLALTQRLLMLLMTLLLIGGGYTAFKELPIDAFPDVSPIQVKIIIKAAGMPPEEIEARITAPIEVELLGIPKQTMLRSIAKYSLTDITVDFAEGTDIYWARQQISERLNAVWADLPEGISGGIAPMTTPLGETFMFTIEGGDLSLMERRSLLDWVIRPALRTVSGVADVNALGGLVRTFSVVPNNVLMTARGISTDQLVLALQHNNRNDGAGRLNEGEEALLVRTEGRIKKLADVEAIVIANNSGIPIRVSDVAKVKIGSLTRYGAVTRNGESEAVEGLVLSLRGANAGKTVHEIENKLAELKSSLPAGVSLEVFYNRGRLVDSAVSSVTSALVQAIIFVIILLVLFLGNVRASLVVALILPLAALFTFILMKITGMTANLMSLGGLAIAIGMLVDASVVVVENILMQFSDKEKAQRLPKLHNIYRATREVAAPVISGSLIVIIVFLPLLALEGLEGKLFAPVALTIVFALVGALILSLTVIPVFASYLLKPEGIAEPNFSKQIRLRYMPILHWSIANSKKVFITAGAMLLVTLGIFMQLGSSFIPTMDEGDIVMQLEKLPSITLENSIALDLQVQKHLLKNVPEIKNIIARVGSDELGLDPMSLNDTDTFLELQPKETWRMDSKAGLIDAIRDVMQGIPGVAYGFTQPIEMRVSEMLTGTRGDVAVKLFGTDLALLNQKAEEIEAALNTVKGATDVFTNQKEGMQYLQITVNRLAAGRLGLDVEQIEKILRVQIEGLKLGVVQEGVRRTALVLKANADSASFENLQITLENGARVPLSMVASIDKVDGIVSIQREHSQRFVVIRSNVEGRDLVGFVEDAKVVVNDKVELPAGYLLKWGGQFENQQRAAKRLAIVVPVSLLLIFLLLFTTFGSLRQAVLVFSNIPLAMIGGVFALWISGEYLSVPAAIGFIGLLGVSVPNSVMLLSYFNQLRATGMEMSKVIILGTERRLRPVLMTASLTAFGLLPMLFASGVGSEIQKPLAIVIIGGLVSSTFLTLVLLPILYKKYGEAKQELV